MKPEATAIGDPQDGRWKITSTFIYSMSITVKKSMDEGFTYSNLATESRSRRHW